MGKLPVLPDITNLKEVPDLVRFISQSLKGLYSLIGGNLNFTDNFRGTIVNVDFVAGQEISIFHNLKFIPSYYILLKTSVAMDIYDGPTLWNDINIYLISNASGNAKLLIL